MSRNAKTGIAHNSIMATAVSVVSLSLVASVVRSSFTMPRYPGSRRSTLDVS